MKTIRLRIPEGMLERIALIGGAPLSQFFDESDPEDVLLKGLIYYHLNNSLDEAYASHTKEIAEVVRENVCDWNMRGGKP